MVDSEELNRAIKRSVRRDKLDLIPEGIGAEAPQRNSSKADRSMKQ